MEELGLPQVIPLASPPRHSTGSQYYPASFPTYVTRGTAWTLGVSAFSSAEWEQF